MEGRVGRETGMFVKFKFRNFGQATLRVAWEEDEKLQFS